LSQKHLRWKGILPMLLCAPISNPILSPFALIPPLADVFPISSQRRDHLTLKMKKRKTTWSRIGFVLTWSMVPNLVKSWVNACAVPPLSPTVSDTRRLSPDILPMNAPCGRLANGVSPLTTHTTTTQNHIRPANPGGAWSGSTTATSVRGARQNPLPPWSMR